MQYSFANGLLINIFGLNMPLNNKSAHREFNEYHLCYLANLKQVYRHLKSQYGLIESEVNIISAVSYYNDPFIESEYDETVYPNARMILKHIGSQLTNNYLGAKILNLCSSGYIKVVREYTTPQGFHTKLYKLDVKGILVCRSFTTYMRNLAQNRYVARNMKKAFKS